MTCQTVKTLQYHVTLTLCRAVCQVTATCSTDAVPLVESLGADLVVDYTTEDADQQLTLMRG